MTDTPTIGLPPLRDDTPPVPTQGDLMAARAKNLLGLVSPVANLGMVPYAAPETRWVGVGAGFVFLGLAAWGWFSLVDWALQLGLVGHYAMVLLGLLHPLWPLAPAKAWVAFGTLLGHVMAYPIFGGLFYLVVSPIALIVRATSGDPLSRKAPPSESYWQEHEPPGRERYQRQF